MHVLITGATGFVGRALALRLLRDGHQVTAWVRSRKRARARLGGDVALIEAPTATLAVHRAVRAADAIVNLAGEPVAGGRWTAKRKQALAGSRIGVTADLVEAIAASDRKPRVLVSASAVGYYGDRGDETLHETSAPGSGFLSDLCQAWEAEAYRAQRLGVRVVTVRLGVVLGRGGGALAKLLTPFRLGVGGRLGDGKQVLPWIHLHDAAEILARAVTDSRLSGAVNAVAPRPVTNRELTKALGRELRRPALLPIPAFAIKAMMGEAASVLLASQRVEPRALARLGFRFQFPTLGEALADILSHDASVSVRRASELPDSDYVRARKPTYVLEQSTLIDAPLHEVFPFFSRAENLGTITPPDMSFEIVGELPGQVQQGTVIDYRIKLGPIPLRWRTVIERWEHGVRFVDAQHRGPYRAWWHEHRFEARGDQTLMTDRVHYAPPFGLLGRLVNRVAIASTLKSIFDYRAGAIRLRFGSRQRSHNAEAA